MKHLKILEVIDTWDKHPKFDDAVKKIENSMKKNKLNGGGNAALDILGDDYPQNLSFARRVIIVANKNLSNKK